MSESNLYQLRVYDLVLTIDDEPEDSLEARCLTPALKRYNDIPRGWIDSDVVRSH